MKIKRITKTKRREHTWDLEVPESNSYYIRTKTSNVLTHNSSRISSSTNGIEPPKSAITFMVSKGNTLPCLIPNIKNKDKYDYAFDVRNEDYLKCAAAIQRWLCMAMSTNTYYRYSDYPDNILPLQEVISDHLKAYKWGIKTHYYLNSDDGNVQNEEEACEGGACSI